MSTWAQLNNSVNLEAPNRFVENNELLGVDNTTLGGRTRRSIRAIKKVWTLTYTYLSASKYDEIYNLYVAGNAVNFNIISDTYVDVDTSVLIDIEVRDFVAGNPDYISNVNIILKEVI